jgi:hypothetical protein
MWRWRAIERLVREVFHRSLQVDGEHHRHETCADQEGQRRECHNQST